MSWVSSIFGGGDTKNTNTTATTYTDASTTLGNNATQANTTLTATGSGVVNVTDGGSTQAALASNTSVLHDALTAMAAVSGAAMTTVGSSSGGGGGFAPAMSAAPAPPSTGLALNKTTLLIGGAIALLAAIFLFRRK